MKNNPVISNIISISNNAVVFNGEKLFEAGNVDFAEFSRGLYRQLKADYPKFYKMDNLCKLGFLAAELLIGKSGIGKQYAGNEIGIVFSNSLSSMDADISHYNTIRDASNFFPSPAVFVYTLPNIVIGEICIRHGITGEGNFFIMEKPDAAFIKNYISVLLDTGRISACLGGWVEYTAGSYEASLFTVEKKTDKKL